MGAQRPGRSPGIAEGKRKAAASGLPETAAYQGFISPD
jgi:hypothetical protein